MCVSFNGNTSTTIISCYNPTNASDETDVITFYYKLSSFVRCIPKHNILIIRGDMNVVYKTHQTEIGQYLTIFSLENRQTYRNTKF